MNEVLAWYLGLSYQEDQYPRSVASDLHSYFIRGLVEQLNPFYYREKRSLLILDLVYHSKDFLESIKKIFKEKLLIDSKVKELDNKYVLNVSGKNAKIIFWWLYHEDFSTSYSEEIVNILTDKEIVDLNNMSDDDSLLELIGAYYSEDNHISFNCPYYESLDLAKKVRNLLSFKTQPVTHTKGKRKHYQLYIPKNQSLTRKASNE